MADYKATLNLPQTDFAMKANLPGREPARLAAWQQENLYSQVQQARAGCDKFVLHDGPPYANGELHVGHAINKILKDMVCKSKVLSGYAATYIPGWDCHGLPIELNVEKKVGKPGQKVSAKEFRQACREYAKGQVAQQSERFQRLGVIGDWAHPYLTMDFMYEANMIRALAKVVDQKAIKAGYKPVFWCLDCQSALAAAEVEYQDKTSSSIDVAFPVHDSAALAEVFNVQQLNNAAIVIWTTTPWTLPANQAVAVHPRLQYALVQAGERQLIIAADLVADCLKRFGIDDYQVLATCFGSDLEHRLVQHPFYERQVPIVLGEHVSLDAGTGAVHTAPAHGPDDYVVAKQYDLPIDNPVLGHGVYNDDVPLLAGQHIKKVEATILDLMRGKQTLISHSQLSHSYPFCWRHKTPLIFRTTPQWFINMDEHELRDRSLQAIKQSAWIPATGEARIASMVDNNPDWCISRQRTWGGPIAIFYHKDTYEIHPNMPALMEQVALLVEQQGLQAWYDLDKNELLGDEADDYIKLNDVLDVWFESGVTHECVLRQRDELQFPADLYLEGSDQHRGWFQSSLLTSMIINDQAPFKTVLTHGFTVDANGRKMSKSLGNILSIDKACKQLGADILRLWVASTDYRYEITVSDEVFKRIGDAYRRIRNTTRFLLANCHDFQPAVHLVAADDLLALDKWIVSRAQALQAEIIAAYDQYQFHAVYQKLQNFCSVELGSFYLDIIKDRQYTMATNSRGRRSAQTAMYHILQALVRWLAPILSFTADEIWQCLPGENSGQVFTVNWYDAWQAVKPDVHLDDAAWQLLIKVREQVNKQLEMARKAGEIGSPLTATVNLYADEALYTVLNQLGDELRFVLITSQAQVLPKTAAPKDVKACDLADLSMTIAAATAPKCARCWQLREDVNCNPDFPEACGRCVINMTEEQGEQRYYA